MRNSFQVTSSLHLQQIYIPVLQKLYCKTLAQASPPIQCLRSDHMPASAAVAMHCLVTLLGVLSRLLFLLSSGHFQKFPSSLCHGASPLSSLSFESHSDGPWLQQRVFPSCWGSSSIFVLDSYAPALLRWFLEWLRLFSYAVSSCHIGCSILPIAFQLSSPRPATLDRNVRLFCACCL